MANPWVLQLRWSLQSSKAHHPVAHPRCRQAPQTTAHLLSKPRTSAQVVNMEAAAIIAWVLRLLRSLQGLIGHCPVAPHRETA